MLEGLTASLMLSDDSVLGGDAKSIRLEHRDF